MKYIIIDDNKNFAKYLCGKLLNKVDENGKLLPCKDEELQLQVDYANSTTLHIAEKIIEKRFSDDVVILININLKTKEDNRQTQKGIELLIWLRIKGVINHCVLYSFETLHAILNREPKHLIATSQGTTIVQLPDDFGKLPLILEKKKEDKKYLAEKENIKATLKPSINIETIRHQEANWWGVKKLWDVHRIMLMKSKADFKYPESLLLKETDLNSQIGICVFESGDSSMGKAIELRVQLKKDYTLYQLTKKSWVENKITENNRNYFSYKVASKSSLHITELRNPKILHIDDQWKDGWGEIFCKMIYGEVNYKPPSASEQEDLHKWNDYMVSLKPKVEINQDFAINLSSILKYDQLV